MNPLIDLTGQVVLVTGSTQGIGLATARQFLEAGATVVLNSRHRERGERVAEELAAAVNPAGDRCWHATADVTDAGQVREMVRLVMERHGRVDVLVNNAGGPDHIQPFRELAPEAWYESFQLKFWSKMYCIREVLEPMHAQGRGAIVNMMSDAGRVGTPGESIISAAYGALLAVTKSLAQEFGRFQVRINNVSITLTGDTGVYDAVMKGEFSRRIFTKIEQRIPLGLLGPDDVAAAIVFLASPAAGKITGQTLSVNGGMTYPS